MNKPPEEMSPDEYRVWQAERWRVMEERERESTLRMNDVERMQVLSGLMATAYASGWDGRMHEGEAEMRAMWQEYRKRTSAQNAAL
ncbi:MAG: hypothetical protein RLZZ303_2491 [Candidatus Hydrogenedentota bacterium]|jgi:hypothetical protein